jgi:hypothetical protein
VRRASAGVGPVVEPVAVLVVVAVADAVV